MKNYDIIIIGGGIAGIYSMYNLQKKYPNLKVLLLEKNERFGGRIYSHYEKIDEKDYIMDLGAGRIGFHHTNMVSLINELKLDKTIIPIENTKNYKETLIKEIKPTWFPELTGTHTFNICNDLLIIDGRLRVNTPFKQFTGKVWKSTDNDDYVNKHINNLNILPADLGYFIDVQLFIECSLKILKSIE